MRVLGRRVVVRRAPITDKIGSIYLPERAKTRPQEAEVVAVGPEVESVAPGMRVLIGRYAGVEFTGVSSETLVLVWEKDLLGVLEVLEPAEAESDSARDE